MVAIRTHPSQPNSELEGCCLLRWVTRPTGVTTRGEGSLMEALASSMEPSASIWWRVPTLANRALALCRRKEESRGGAPPTLLLDFKAWIAHDGLQARAKASATATPARRPPAHRTP